MPRSALPSHLNDAHEIEKAFPDDEQFGTSTWYGRLYRWLNKSTKTWFVFSYRATEWWARWRRYPVVLLAIGSNDAWRMESKFGEVFTFNPYKPPLHGYLSRIQYYKRWHLAIFWPLMLSFHFYPKASDVPVYDSTKRPTGLKGKVWFGYLNHFDNDLVYWMLTSAFLGRTWK